MHAEKKETTEELQDFSIKEKVQTFHEFLNVVERKLEEDYDPRTVRQFSSFSVYYALFREDMTALQVEKFEERTGIVRVEGEGKMMLRCQESHYIFSTFALGDTGNWELTEEWTFDYDAGRDKLDYTYRNVWGIDPVLQSICLDIFRETCRAANEDLPLVKMLQTEYDRFQRESTCSRGERWHLEARATLFSFLHLLGGISYAYFKDEPESEDWAWVYRNIVTYSSSGVVSELDAQHRDLAMKVFANGYQYAAEKSRVGRNPLA